MKREGSKPKLLKYSKSLTGVGREKFESEVAHQLERLPRGVKNKEFDDVFNELDQELNNVLLDFTTKEEKE